MSSKIKGILQNKQPNDCIAKSVRAKKVYQNTNRKSYYEGKQNKSN